MRGACTSHGSPRIMPYIHRGTNKQTAQSSRTLWYSTKIRTEMIRIILHVRTACHAVQLTAANGDYYVTTRHAISHRTVSYHTIPPYPIPHHPTPYLTMSHYTTPCHAIPCRTNPYHGRVTRLTDLPAAVVIFFLLLPTGSRRSEGANWVDHRVEVERWQVRVFRLSHHITLHHIHIRSHHITSHHIMPYHIIVISYHTLIIRYHCHVMCHVLSGHVVYVIPSII